MSGDVQPRKRKDKKRKKDDEDTVKDTPGGKQTSAGAAQAATQPGDVQMHVHSDHGTGGHWCAKVVFFILLAGLGALIGLILIENRGLSDVDTPLSESRYAEYFSGWVDENHEDDHHHEDILNAINQLDDHGDDDDGNGDDGHGDDDDGHDGDDEHEDDDENGAPYAEEDDHDDEDGGDDEDDDEEQAKLDDDEVEEVVATEKKVARQEAAAAADDDDEDGDDDDNADEDEPAAAQQQQDDDDDDENDGDDINDADDKPADDDDDDDDNQQPDMKNDDDGDDADDKPANADAEDDDDDDNTPFEEEDDNDDEDDDQNNAVDDDDDDETDNKADDDKEDNDGDDDDDDDDNVFENFVDNDDGEEEYLAKVKQEQEQKIQQKRQQEQEDSREETSQIPSRPSASETYEEELDRAKRQLDELKNPKLALELYESLLAKQPQLVPAIVGKARALDLLADQRQSNKILEDAIESYHVAVSHADEVDDETLISVAERCIERIRFRGQYLKAVDIHQALIRRFDGEPKYRNQLAVTYLLSNRLPEAKAVLHETLMRWIENGFALVHYGFVLKNLDKDMEQAAQYLQEGIDTGDAGTQDGRFYFHLGDALQRLGRQKEALVVYQRAADKKLFPSMYQRSLYNVDNLKSRPFWTIEQTTFAGQLELIRSQWVAIRDEGLKLLNSAGSFRDEAENLRDTGDWKQFELFLRGQRIDKNCAKAPLTCKLVEQFTAARSCKRGQVKFSVMHPGTHVWPHCGPTNCRIRAHLGLKVPSGTFIRVATETRSWENGKWLIFDDSFEHEVWHNGTSTRLVLIVDFWHPDLTETQRKTLNPI